MLTATAIRTAIQTRPKMPLLLASTGKGIWLIILIVQTLLPPFSRRLLSRGEQRGYMLTVM